jgi:hypothetical protein
MPGPSRRRPALALVLAAVLLVAGWQSFDRGPVDAGDRPFGDTAPTAQALDGDRPLADAATAISRAPEPRSNPLPLLALFIVAMVAIGVGERAPRGVATGARRVLSLGGVSSRAPPTPLLTLRAA